MAEPKTTNLPKAGSRQARQRAQKEQEADLETLVTELEQRVDRLRAAYDQYFMGIEKLPPHVQIKDVERRLQDLRKIQIRNTALRFKFQNTLQRYNTYQSYWARIVRQIEEGTYKRDVRRANERFGTGAQRRGAAKEIEIDVDLDDLMSEDADLDDLLKGSDLDEDAPDTLRPAAPPEFDMPEIPRPAESRRFTLDPPDMGIPYVAPQGPIEERPSQKHLSRTGGARATLPPVAAPPPRPRTMALYPPAAAPPARQEPAPAPAPAPAPVPAPSAGAQAAPAKRKSAAPPPKDGNRPPARKSTRPATNGAKPPEPRPAAKPGDLSEQRLRQLYSQYVETKRAQKESTAALSYESLSKSLRESSERLKEKHGGKKVDFEVTVKDGKTILRPVVK